MDQERRKGRRLITTFHDILLLALLLVTTVAVVRLRNLVAVVMLLGLYSLLMAAVWVVLDAVDVAFTEAAVGAGITTFLMLAAVLASYRGYDTLGETTVIFTAGIAVLVLPGGRRRREDEESEDGE